ncbi:MAG: hypothetical protein AAGA54_12435 [Myxococcota bacterium]
MTVEVRFRAGVRRFGALALLLGACTAEAAPGAETDGATSSADDDAGVDDGADDDSTGETPADWGREEEFELRLGEDDVPPLMLQMSRDEVAELFGDRADEVLLLELDSAQLLENTLDKVKLACGIAWQLDNENPNHDCSLTALGSSFEGPDGTWRTSPEYAMVRILTMTPANVDVSGTSSQSLAGLADALGIGGGYSEILADALGIPRTQEIVSTASLVHAFQTGFVGSHPNVGEGGTISIYLSDALSDLGTMSETLGPQGDHPGLVDPGFTVTGEVFGPNFTMNAIAESNLRLVDGIDGGQGKGFLTVVEDRTGPTFDDELEFDFADPERFSLEGILESLQVDMRFAIGEADTFIPSCLSSPCQQNLPGNPVGTDTVWNFEPWLLEYNVAVAAYEEYKERLFDESYLLGTASVQIGQNGNPPGWVEYSVPFNIGSPPEDQFVWETILEVAQVALHNTPFTTFSEGDADIAFTVEDIPIGITGPEAAEAVRPFLQEQAALLSDFLLGDFREDNDRVDLYWRRADNGRPYLFFVDPSDLASDADYQNDNPGFFAAPSRSPGSKLSNTEVAGVSDTLHEKYEPPAGETTLYYEDDDGTVFRLRIVRDGADAETLRVFVAEGL